METTLIILKPDAVQRGLMGRIISRFEDKGLQIVGMKLMRISDALAGCHSRCSERLSVLVVKPIATQSRGHGTRGTRGRRDRADALA